LVAYHGVVKLCDVFDQQVHEADLQYIGWCVKTQSKVVARLTLLVAITVLLRSGSVAVEPLHLRRLARSPKSARLHPG